MKFLFIDTCIYIQCCLLEIEGDDIGALNRVHDLLNGQKVKLLLPEVVEREFYKILNHKQDALKRKIGSYQEVINKDNELDKKIKVDLLAKIKQVTDERAANTEKAIKEIDMLFNSPDTVKLPLKSDHFVFAYRYFLSSFKPYKADQGGEIQPDSLIVGSLSEYLDDKNDYSFYFCSSNSSDFASEKDANKLSMHPDIGKRFKSVKYYSNLYELLNKEFGASYSKSSIDKLEEKKIETESDVTLGVFGVEQISKQTNYFTEGSKKLVSIFWPLILDRIKAKKSVISALLRDCKIESDGDEVRIYTKYKFHFDKLNSSENKQLVEDCLLQVTNRNYKVIIYGPFYFKSVVD